MLLLQYNFWTQEHYVMSNSIDGLQYVNGSSSSLTTVCHQYYKRESINASRNHQTAIIMIYVQSNLVGGLGCLYPATHLPDI